MKALAGDVGRSTTTQNGTPLKLKQLRGLLPIDKKQADLSTPETMY